MKQISCQLCGNVGCKHCNNTGKIQSVTLQKLVDHFLLAGHSRYYILSIGGKVDEVTHNAIAEESLGTLALMAEGDRIFIAGETDGNV